MVVCVESVVTSGHSVRVYKWYDFESVLFKKNARLLTSGKQQVQNSIQYMRSLNLTRMHSSCQKYHRLLKFMTPLD